MHVSVSIHATEGVVVLGSFTNRDNAELQRLKLSKQLEVSIDSVNVDVGGVRHYRVVTDQMSKADAHTWITATQTQGIAGWFAPTTSVQEQPVPPAKPPTKATPAFASLRRAPQQTPTADVRSTSVRTAPQTGDVIEIPYFDAVDIVID